MPDILYKRTYFNSSLLSLCKQYFHRFILLISSVCTIRRCPKLRLSIICFHYILVAFVVVAFLSCAVSLYTVILLKQFLHSIHIKMCLTVFYYATARLHRFDR